MAASYYAINTEKVNQGAATMPFGYMYIYHEELLTVDYASSDVIGIYDYQVWARL